MFWNFYLPVAGHSLNIFMLLGLGMGVGCLSGLTGVGGGFLMTPLLIMAGIPPTIAAASDSNQIVASTTSGTFAHYRMGNVDLKMGTILLLGGFLGGSIGVEIIKVLRLLGGADFFIKITYVVMLTLVGSYMLVESIQSRKKAADGRSDEEKPISSFRRFTSSSPLANPFRQIERDLIPYPAFPGWDFCRYAGGDHGFGRRLHNGAADVLCAGNAHACSDRD